MPNIIVLTGNLGDDPKIHYSSDGKPVAKFDLAFRSGKQKTGWVKVVCFQKIAESVEQHLHKGARITVTGALDKESWETESGEKRSTFQVIGNGVEFIKTDGRGFENGNTHEDGTPF